MVRQIIIPTQTSLTITLPNEMIGKEIEVIAFEIEEVKKIEQNVTESSKDVFEDIEIDLSDFKFNRDEANDYDR